MNYNKKLKAAVCVIGSVIALGTPVTHAQTVTDTFTVSAVVESVCEVTANDLDFGTYSPLSAVPLVSGVSTIDVTCNLLTPHDIGISSGANSADVTTRAMMNTDVAITSDNLLNYTLGCVLNVTLPPVAAEILTNCATNWGETPGVLGIGGDTFFAIGTGLTIPVVLSGTIPAGQNVAIGTYQDTLTATVTF